MTRLDRVLNLLEQYDIFALELIYKTGYQGDSLYHLSKLRFEKEKLIQEFYRARIQEE